MKKHLSPFDCVSPLDSRYYAGDEEFYAAIHPYLSETASIRYQMKVEQALIAELEAEGVAPKGISKEVARVVVDITPDEVYEEERRIHHNVRALANCIRTRLPEAYRGYVHLFATSNDVTDTARALMLRDVTREVLLPDLHALLVTLAELARQHADAIQIGRTHGRHAVPITLGYWLANYVDRIGQRMEALASAASNLRGMMSGAVGAHNSFALRWPEQPAAVETAVLARLGLRPSPTSVSTQIVQPEYVVDFAHAVVSTFSVLANLADDYRHLMRSEIEEVAENTAMYVGSSTMPHKVNPKNFENVKSLWKEFAPRMTTFYMDQISEHQRDLTNSASGRFVSELAAGFVYATRRLTEAVKGTVVNTESLQKCFNEGKGWTVAEPLYIALALAQHGDAYEISKSLVSKSREARTTLLRFLQEDPEARGILNQVPREYRDIIVNPERYLGDARDRTITVCEFWLGKGDKRGRVNPLETLQAALGRPHENQTLIAH